MDIKLHFAKKTQNQPFFHPNCTVCFEQLTGRAEIPPLIYKQRAYRLIIRHTSDCLT
jgi:hypothetical protein